MMTRIYANKWHVYAGLAMMNPSAKAQVRQYARSVTDLFSLMVQQRSEAFEERIEKAKTFVFGGQASERVLLLSDDLLDEHSLRPHPVHDAGRSSPIDRVVSPVPNNAQQSLSHCLPNSHLSLLAIVDSWFHLGLQPYLHIQLCETPLFRLWLGIAEYLYCSNGGTMLRAAVRAAMEEPRIRGDDLQFCLAVQGWAAIICDETMDAVGDMKETTQREAGFGRYAKRFKDTASFFHDRLAEGKILSQKLIAKMKAKRK